MHEKEAIQLVRDIESDRVELIYPEDHPYGPPFYNGNVHYGLPDGRWITVFVDAGEFDYIDSMRISRGVVLDFDCLCEIPELRDYRPAPEVEEHIYGIGW